MSKVKISGSRRQLESVGIDYDITGLTGVVTFNHYNGYNTVEVTHTLGKLEFTNSFDIPVVWLEKI